VRKKKLAGVAGGGGALRESKRRRTSAVGSRCQVTTSRDWEDFIYALGAVISGVCHSVRLS
jgi:hypothetical protein